MKQPGERGRPFLKKVIFGTNHQVVGGVVVVAIVAVLGTAGKLIWSAMSGHDDDPREFLAEVAWTDDVKGQNPSETNLYSFTTPYSHVHKYSYTLGQALTVTCRAQGREVDTGPLYKGPSPEPKIWYKLDNGTWVPSVYVRVGQADEVPRCP